MSLRKCGPWEGDVPRKQMSLGTRCAQEEDIPGRRHPQQGDIAGKVSSTGSCPWEEDVSGKIASPGRRHPARMSLGRCHPQGGVSGKVSGRGCPWEDVILRKEMCLRRCLQEDTVLGKKMFPGSRYTWEDVIPWKATSLSWTSQGRCHLQGCVTRKKTSQGRRHPLGRRHPPSSSPHPWSPSRERQGTQ